MDMNGDLIQWLRTVDVWPFMAGLFLILWVVEVKFGGRARVSREQILAARLKGYDMATEQQRESDTRRWAKEWESEKDL